MPTLPLPQYPELDTAKEKAQHTTMIKALRDSFFAKAIKQLLAKNTRHRKPHTLDTANTVGILFDATAEKKRIEITELAKKLEKRGKQVKLLGYINEKKPNVQTFDFSHFTKKETTWTGQPKSEKAADFAKEKFDLLFVFNDASLTALQWVAIQSEAAMKVGFATALNCDLDLQLELPVEKGIAYFMEQFEKYTSTFVISKHGTTKTS